MLWSIPGFYMIRLLPIVLLLLVLQGCTKQGPVEETEPLPVDSFSVSGIDVGQQVQGFEYLSDTQLCSYNLIHKELVYFRKKSPGQYQAAVRRPIEAEAWSSHFTGDDHLNYFLSRDNVLSCYNATADQMLWKRPIRHVFPYLRDSFSIFSPHSAPIVKRHDTLIASLSHGFIQSYPQYFKEPEIAEFRLTPDSIAFLRNYITKPSSLPDYCFPLSKYCLQGNHICLIYPCFDTLYRYDRMKNTLTKTRIGNRDYQLPAKFDMSKLWTPDYGSYQTNYSLHSFSYSAIYYNPLTKHFILFYGAPVSNVSKDKMATPDDQKMKAMILDEHFKPLKYYIFKSRNFVLAESYFIVPGKGLAMPVFKGHDDYETTLFYIYNL